MTTLLQENLLSEDATVLMAAKALERARPKLVIVADAERRIRGTVTDGDIRRGLLRGVRLDDPVAAIMNTEPVIGRLGENPKSFRQRMLERDIQFAPIVDADGRFVSLRKADSTPPAKHRDNLVVLLAGGLGTRLRPLTNQCPKPMLEVGDKPLLQLIIERLKAHGFHRFRISVNYRAEIIKQHFGDGSLWDVDIRYLDEDSPLGTAGPLGLLDETPEHPLIVINGDVLSTVDFGEMLDFHIERDAAATVGARTYDFQIPFGTLDLQDGNIVSITEKPTKSVFVNAGMYVLSPSVVANIRPRERLDMPDLLKVCIGNGHPVVAFPIHEYWLDIGRHADFEQAQIDVPALC